MWGPSSGPRRIASCTRPPRARCSPRSSSPLLPHPGPIRPHVCRLSIRLYERLYGYMAYVYMSIWVVGLERGRDRGDKTWEGEREGETGREERGAWGRVGCVGCGGCAACAIPYHTHSHSRDFCSQQQKRETICAQVPNLPEWPNGKKPPTKLTSQRPAGQ